eukprot:7288102-Heterocapsa_arctica.AAC.1
MAGQLHRRPPHTRLGTPEALCSLDLSDDMLRTAGADPASVSPHIASVDLTDCFYQYRSRELAEWFACEWPEEAQTWG